MQAIPTAPPRGAQALSCADRRVFCFTYEGEPRPLRDYLLARYRFGRSAQWAEQFYPDRVQLNGVPVDAGTPLHPGDRIAYEHWRGDEPPPPPPPVVLREDACMLALFKPDTVPVSPSGVYYFSSFAILAREAFANPELTPVHRLDLETAGPLLFAKRRGEARLFHKLFQRHAVRKIYRALVHGTLPAGLQEISGAIVPDPASAIYTRLRLLPEGDGPPTLTRIGRVVPRGAFSEVELEPVTGKTNQLRVHLAAVGHPIVGDKKYHPDEAVFLDWFRHRDFARLRERLLLPRQALLCQALAFPHPVTGEPVRVQAPPGSWARKLAPLMDPCLPEAVPL